MAGTETKATAEQKRARIRKSYDLSEKGDYEGSFREGWTDNGVFHSQMRGREFRGKAAIIDEVKKQNQEVKTIWHLHDVLVSDDHAVALLEA
jgi:DNA-binding PadR family transcriptional regulator